MRMPKTKRAAAAFGRRMARAFLAAGRAIEKLPKRERMTCVRIVAVFFDVEAVERLCVKSNPKAGAGT